MTKRRQSIQWTGQRREPWWPVALFILIIFICAGLPHAISYGAGHNAMSKEGKVARSAPLAIKRYRLALSIGHDLRLPSDVAVGPRGWIYVMDGTQDVVRIYNPRGEELFTLGGSGVLKMPLGLDVTRDGDVVVADSGNHRLAIFPPGINAPRYIPVPSPHGGRPSDPTDVVMDDRSGRLITVDNDNHRVLAMDLRGKILWSTGEMGRGVEEFRFPFLMAMDAHGRTYVVEVINTRVQVLDEHGKFSGFIGGWGVEPGQFYRPKGVAVDEQGLVFVSDSYIGVVQIFGANGQFVGAVGDEKGKLWRFQTPVGLATEGKRLYVVEMIRNRVLVLEAVER